MATRLAIREKQLETWTAIIQECRNNGMTTKDRLYFCIISCILQGVQLTRAEVSRRNHCPYRPCVPESL